MAPARPLDVAAFLTRLPLFSDIGDEARHRLAGGCALRRLERGDVVFAVGDPCDAFFVVVTGRVKLYLLSAAGQEKVLELVGPGSSFAEAFLFLGRPCLVNARVLADSLLLAVSRDAVLAEVGRDSQFALRMIAGLSRRLHGLVQDVQGYALMSGVQRVIGFLLSERHGQDGAQGTAVTVSLAVSKATLASRLSLTPEYFSRVLRELEDAGLIEVDKRDIRIVDAAGLAAYEGNAQAGR